MPAVFAAVVAAIPLLYLAVRAGEDGLTRVVEVLLRARTAELLGRSLLLAVVVTGACVVVGVAAAWLVVRTDVPGRPAWAVVAAMPLAIPSYVAGYTWISSAPWLAGLPGAALVLTLCCYPYVYLPVAAALRGLDPAQAEVSRALGSGSTTTFTRVVLPQLAPAIGGGALLVSLYALSDFGAISIMRYDAFPLAIYTSYRASFDRTPAAVLGCLLVAVTLVVVALEARTRGRGRVYASGGGAPATPARIQLGRGRIPALLALLALAALALGLPAVSMVHWLIQGAATGIDLPDVGRAAAGTILLSAFGAVVTTALAVPVGVLAARSRSRLVTVLERTSYAGHALPGIVVALSVVFLAVRYFRPLYQTTPNLVMAYVVLFLPLGVAAVRASVAQFPPALEEVARSLGRRPVQVLGSITLPLAAPGVAAAATLIFLTCMKELPATLLLVPTGVDTLATRLWTKTGVAAYSEAAPYAALLVLLSAVPTWLLGRRIDSRRPDAVEPA